MFIFNKNDEEYKYTSSKNIKNVEFGFQLYGITSSIAIC